MPGISINTLLRLDRDAQRAALLKIEETDFRAALQDFILQFEQAERKEFPVSLYFEVLSLLKTYHFLKEAKVPTPLQIFPLSDILEDCFFAMQLISPTIFSLQSDRLKFVSVSGKNLLFLLFELLAYLAENSQSGRVIVSVLEVSRGIILQFKSRFSCSMAEFLHAFQKENHLFRDMCQFFRDAKGQFFYVEETSTQGFFCFFPKEKNAFVREIFTPDIFSMLQNRFSPFYVALYGERK